MKVAMVYYQPGSEQVTWEDMPAVPRVGDRVHRPEMLPKGAPLRSFAVRTVTWQRDDNREWFPEVSMSQ